jgi:hypothetical protein
LWININQQDALALRGKTSRQVKAARAFSAASLLINQAQYRAVCRVWFHHQIGGSIISLIPWLTVAWACLNGQSKSCNTRVGFLFSDYWGSVTGLSRLKWADAK